MAVTPSSSAPSAPEGRNSRPNRRMWRRGPLGGCRFPAAEIRLRHIAGRHIRIANVPGGAYMSR